MYTWKSEVIFIHIFTELFRKNIFPSLLNKAALIVQYANYLVMVAMATTSMDIMVTSEYTIYIKHIAARGGFIYETDDNLQGYIMCEKEE